MNPAIRPMTAIEESVLALTLLSVTAVGEVGVSPVLATVFSAPQQLPPPADQVAVVQVMVSWG